jgi:hypothetical protein
LRLGLQAVNPDARQAVNPSDTNPQVENKEINMSEQRYDDSRRRFLRAGLLGVAAVPAAGLLMPARARAQGGAERVDPSDPAATALNYVEDASKVESPPRQEGAICGNCQLWSGGDSEWGPCAAFGGKNVAREGWCSAWVKAG